MSQRNITAVVLWMGGTLLSFSVLAVSFRALADRFSVFEILTIRCAAGLAIIAALAVLHPGLRRDLAARRLGLHLARNAIHFLGQYAWTFALTVLPLATAFAIEFTTPAWVALLAVFLLGERMSVPRAGVIACGFIGVLVILRPGAATLHPASLVMLGSALAFAAAAIATKKLTRTETTLSILFWMNLMQLLMSYAGSDPWFFLELGEAPLLPLLGTAIAGVSAHLCLTNAYRHGDAIMVVPLDFLRIPIIALVGYWLYGEPLDPFVFAGAALIIGGIVWGLRAEAAAARRSA